MFVAVLEHAFIYLIIVKCVFSLAVELAVFPLTCVNVTVLEIVCALALEFALLFLTLVVWEFLLGL